VALADESGVLRLRFFHPPRALEARLERGRHLACYGEPRRGPLGLEMVHPECRFLAPGEPLPLAAALTPVYPSTEGLAQASLRRLIGEALARLEGQGGLAELLPADALEDRREPLPGLVEALRTVHAPPPGSALEALASGRHPAVRRLALEELLAHHLALRLRRRRTERRRAPALLAPPGTLERLWERLPFALTAAQRRVVAEVGADLARPQPMQRLLQGDVGSGKTVVAAAAALQAVAAGWQAALMAPTELLAEQHLASLEAWLAPLGVRVAALSARLGAGERRERLAALAGEQIDLAVGTHALFQEAVVFARLGLVVIDEQHRFGVHQRLALRGKGDRGALHPHQLVMTATPIPRTLAMTAYADLDTSVIDELPPGRAPVETVVVPERRRAEVIERVAAACRGGAQAFWVCTLIEESEALECQAAEETARALAAALPGLRVGLAHGRMKAAERGALMERFRAAEIDLLVATTVVEVGVDVPGASLMIVENAERLGLAQLHQLRGRVGRGRLKSTCVLLYAQPLGALARARLECLRETRDGFRIAERDLELRGPGELLGTRQAGLLRLRVADLARDRDLLGRVARIGARLLEHDPEAARALVRRWVGDALHYADV